MVPWTAVGGSEEAPKTDSSDGDDKLHVNMASVDVGPEPSLGQRLRTSCFTLAAFLLMLVVLPVAVPLLLVFRIYRSVLRSLIQKLEGDNAHFVSGDDSVWLQDSPENRAIINALIQLRGAPDLAKLSKVLSERLVQAKDPKDPTTRLFPKITRYATKILRRYVWYEDPDFDVRNHVFFHTEPVAGAKSDLERVVSELCSSPLPTNKPGWQFIIIRPPEGDPDHGQKYHVVFRVHHSIADGISLIRTMMQIVVDEQPKPNTYGHCSSRDRLKMLWKAVFEGPAFIVNQIFQRGDRNLLHGRNLSGTKLVSWSEPIDLGLIKQVKSATGTTVNDVIVSCLASTFRDYFKETSSGPVPPHILAYIPVNIRPASAPLTLDNQFAVVLMSMPTEDDDQLKTLKRTKVRMDQIKNSPEPIVSAYTIKYCMNRLPNWLSKLFFDWISTKSSVVVSNVPGPRESVSLGGNEIESVVFWPPQKSNVGMGASVFSYRDTIRLGIYVDRTIMTNPRTLVDRFSDNVHKLVNVLKLE